MGYMRLSTKEARELEHRKIWRKAHGPIPKGMIVHHINEKKRDNKITNLQLLTRAEHASLHHKGRKKSAAWRKKISLGRRKFVAQQPKKPCDVFGCKGKYYAKGYCKEHYERLKRTGTTLDLR